jgi:CheY-like chemotaxis protein
MPADTPLAFSQPLFGVRVLLVEDYDDARDMLTLMLQMRGAEVWATASVADALALLEHHVPDVLVSDISMPVEDGFSLIRKLRMLDRARGGHIPAIAVTAHGSPEDRAAVLEAGFDAHMPKPLEPDDLVAVIASLRA